MGQEDELLGLERHSQALGHGVRVDVEDAARGVARQARHDGHEPGDRLRHRRVHVVAVERLGRRREHGDLADAGCEGAVEALSPEKVIMLPDGVEDLWNDSYADLVSLA